MDMDELPHRPQGEQVSFWLGRICLAIGKGDVRDVLLTMIVYYQREAFERGVELGMRKNKPKHDKDEASRKASASAGY